MDGSIANLTTVEQHPVDTGETFSDAFAADRIVEILARRRHHNSTLVIADLSGDEQRELRGIAAMALAAEDSTAEIGACYAAADAMIAVTGAGPLLGSLSRQRRSDKVRLAIAGIRTYRRALAGQVPGPMRHYTTLADADARTLPPQDEAQS